MSEQYDDRDRGALFKNDDKQSERHPDYKGQINVGGTEYWISAWLKTSKGGMKYMSLAVTPKQAREHKSGTANPPARTAAPEPEFSDEIPF